MRNSEKVHSHVVINGILPCKKKNNIDSLVVQMVKSLPAMQETTVRSLGWEDPLEKEMATHSSISCLGSPMDRGDWQVQSMGSQEPDTTE